MDNPPVTGGFFLTITGGGRDVNILVFSVDLQFGDKCDILLFSKE